MTPSSKGSLMNDKLWYIKSADVFHGMPSQEHEHLASISRMVSFRRDKVILVRVCV